MLLSNSHHIAIRMLKKLYSNRLLNDTFNISRLRNVRFSHDNSTNNPNGDDTIKSNNSELSSADCASEEKIPTPPTNCCMSGCANCVWIQYAEELSTKLQNGSDVAKEIIMKEVQDANMRSFLEMELRILKSKNVK